MSSYGDLYQLPPKLPPGLEVETFKEEVFKRVDDAEPIPDPSYNFDKDRPQNGPPPDPFEEFEVERTPLSRLMADLPSLDALFKPFDLASENPAANAFEDMHEYAKPSEYVYEDMDLRDPDVVKTLARAEEIFQKKALEAEENAAMILEAARTEAKGIAIEAETEARARADAIMDEAKEASRALAAKTEADRTEAEEYLARAKVSETEADEKLAAVKDRIAGLDTERAAMEAEFSSRKASLEKEIAGARAEIESTRQKIWDEALAKATEEGTSRGLTQGLTEGRNRGYKEAGAAFNEKVAGFVPIMEKMENIYNDLWKANSPMMVQLAIEAAGQILNKELREAGDLTVRAFEACIDYLSQARRVTFLARPRDIAALEEARAEYRQRLGALLTVTFKPEESLGPGDLIMESDVGRLDATVKHRAAQVMDVLRRAFDENYVFAPPPEEAEELGEGEPAAAPETAPEENPVILDEENAGKPPPELQPLS